MNGYIDADRLKELYELCQESNFNTPEQAHTALRNGIAGMLNSTEVLEMDIRRLKVGDEFEAVKGGKTYSVVSRFTKAKASMRLETMRPAHKEPTVDMLSTFDIVEWLEILPQGGSLDMDTQFVNIRSGLVHESVASKPNEGMSIGPSVFLISKP